MSPPPHPPLRSLKSETPLAERDDDALMLLASSGLRDAFAVLVARHQRALRSFCGRCSGDARAADDLAQEVFVTVWRQRAAYQARGQFKAYLFTIAFGRAQNERRARRRRGEPAGELAVDPDRLSQLSSTQLDALVVSERQQRLHELVRKLPEEQRQAIWLRYAAELAYAEIAEITHKPEATIRSRVFLGLRQLKKLVGKKRP